MQPLLKRQRGHGQQEAPILALDCGSSCHELDPLHPVVFLKTDVLVTVFLQQRGPCALSARDLRDLTLEPAFTTSARRRYRSEFHALIPVSALETLLDSFVCTLFLSWYYRSQGHLKHLLSSSPVPIERDHIDLSS